MARRKRKAKPKRQKRRRLRIRMDAPKDVDLPSLSCDRETRRELQQACVDVLNAARLNINDVELSTGTLTRISELVDAAAPPNPRWLKDQLTSVARGLAALEGETDLTDFTLIERILRDTTTGEQ